MRRGFRRRIPPVKILSDCEVEALHRATLNLLEEVGCRFESKKALEILKKNGCIVNYEDFRSRIPAYLVVPTVSRPVNGRLQGNIMTFFEVRMP